MKHPGINDICIKPGSSVCYVPLRESLDLFIAVAAFGPFQVSSWPPQGST